MHPAVRPAPLARRAPSRLWTEGTRGASAPATLLFVALMTGALVAPADLAALNGSKRGDSVRVTADQMHQLQVVNVELYPFRVQKFAIGQIAYNEDNSTAVMTPFSGRVTRLMARIGDKVSRGDPLFDIDSPEAVQPQNDFIAAVLSRALRRDAVRDAASAAALVARFSQIEG